MGNDDGTPDGVPPQRCVFDSAGRAFGGVERHAAVANSHEVDSAPLEVVVAARPSDSAGGGSKYRRNQTDRIRARPEASARLASPLREVGHALWPASWLRCDDARRMAALGIRPRRSSPAAVRSVMNRRTF